MNNIEDVVGMFPVLQTRVGILERRTCPQMTARMDELEGSVKLIQRSLGLREGFSLKAWRAQGQDVPLGLAAAAEEPSQTSGPQAPPLHDTMLDYELLENSIESLDADLHAQAAHVSIQQRICDIEQKIQAMSSAAIPHGLRRYTIGTPPGMASVH